MGYTAEQIFSRAPVIPVITIDDPDTAVPLARALVKGGLPVLEITLRTAQGLDAIRRVRDEVDDAVVGAGTVLNQRDLERALAAGSEFVITPGLTPELLRAGAACGVPFMPGIATVSEMMCCLDAGLTALKFFPAESSGGARALRAFSGPFPQVSVCPTGGIGPDNLTAYLAVPSVRTIGGSWMTPRSSVAAGDWEGITALAREACDLVGSIRSRAEG